LEKNPKEALSYGAGDKREYCCSLQLVRIPTVSVDTRPLCSDGSRIPSGCKISVGQQQQDRVRTYACHNRMVNLIGSGSDDSSHSQSEDIEDRHIPREISKTSSPRITTRNFHRIFILSCRSYDLMIVGNLSFAVSLLSMTTMISMMIGSTDAFGVKEPVSVLLQKYVSEIARLKEQTQSVVGSIDSLPYNNDVFYLRYCLAEKGVTELRDTLAWRMGEGKEICQLAITAFQKASAGAGGGGGKWDNAPVRDGAPNANKINQYITPSQCLTTSSSVGDLIYCIRAGKINDVALMSAVTSEEMVDFFLYCKELNALVANDRSLDMDKVIYIITANDLNGLQLIGGDATFRNALSTASKKGNALYPSMNGPTLLLNLPRLMSALVKLFTPLFPPEINARLKFERGPLVDVVELMDISYGGKDRDVFLKDVEKLCYGP